MMRSKLFVPCARPDLFAKALASDADAISFDLEDSVTEDGKPAARRALAEVLTSDAVRASAKRIIVRVNALETLHFADDLAALAGGRVDLINLPKADGAAAVIVAALAIEAAGLDARLLVTIETPLGLLSAAEIAAAHPRIVGLQVGLNDLFATLGVDRSDPRHVHAALWQMRLASGVAGCFAYDGAWPDIRDTDGLRAEANLARSLGYAGKSCIHPSQIPIVNAVFDRDAALAEARRIVAAAERSGHGAFTLDGWMIDRPMIDRARTLLAGHQ